MFGISSSLPFNQQHLLLPPKRVYLSVEKLTVVHSLTISDRLACSLVWTRSVPCLRHHTATLIKNEPLDCGAYTRHAVQSSERRSIGKLVNGFSCAANSFIQHTVPWRDLWSNVYESMEIVWPRQRGMCDTWPNSIERYNNKHKWR